MDVFPTREELKLAFLFGKLYCYTMKAVTVGCVAPKRYAMKYKFNDALVLSTIVIMPSYSKIVLISHTNKILRPLSRYLSGTFP